MKKILSNAKVAFILLLITGILLDCYIHVITRPVSYGLPYRNETLYDSNGFEETMTFYRDGSVVTESTELDEPIVNYYHYRGGRLFILKADTEEGRKEEIQYINKNFKEASSVPSYSESIDAFVYTTEDLQNGDEGYFIYACKTVYVFTVTAGIIELVMIGLTCASLILYSKAQRKKKA